MPAAGAHYQFGQLVFGQCSTDITEKIRANKEMFDLGTQGPDILFFYRPYRKNPVSQLGSTLHSYSGCHLFLPLIAHRAEWSAGLTAYLLGLCCHYGLDRICHPLINQLAPSGYQHQELEAALDRLIFDQYDITIGRQKMIPKKVDIPALQKVYSQLTRGDLREAAISLHYYNHLLEHPKVVGFVEKIVGRRGAFSAMCVPKTVAEDATARQVVPLFPEALRQTLRLMELILEENTTEDDLLREMNLNYEGERL